ncbi:hypothetical protein JJB99_11355 [Bradyrhizobium diazoefficiens]|uniref:hypothetical protein n=1 Tax=Bradyrhizobium diazoefficiens TaxID=1355477 RepID=UPI00190B38FC|nr:hypothetical protein [Bradyrhizobium diazoefficiens]QQO16703.1 hypothetical protein JJB99_11355 [Bradyrhizobium diazoefficiens]
MAKRVKEPSQREILASIRKTTEKERVEEAEFERQIAALFEAANWSASRLPDGGRTRPGDLLVKRNDLGRERRYIIDAVSEINPPRLRQAFEDFRHSIEQKKEPDFDEYWLVGQYFIGEPMRKMPRNDRRFRALDLKQLRELLAIPKPKKSKASTRLGKAVLANEKEIYLAIAGLILQIEAKLEALRGELPNSDDGQSRVAREISGFERMKAELERIREMVAAFKKGKAPDQEVVKATKTFRQGVEEWWTNKSGEILTSTAKGAILVSSVGLLALMKADSVAAITAVAAVVNGGAIEKAKKIGRAMKRIGKQALTEEAR